MVTSLQRRLSEKFPDYRGDVFKCTLCEVNLNRFAPLPPETLGLLNDHEYIHPAFRFETLNFQHYNCPACGGTDRDRLYAIFLSKYFAGAADKIRLVEFAPSPQLSRFIRKFPNVEHRTADLYQADVDDVVDLMAMDSYEPGRFNFFICSHILEHVDNDLQAMRELFRILSPTGKGIVMVPIDLSLTEVYENSNAVTEADRWKHFGQNDHVRLYSKVGFVERLEQVGFHVEQLGIDYFGREVFERAGIHPRSVLYVVDKS